MSVDDLEPIDVEPVDLEPVDLEPIDLQSEDASVPERAPSSFRWASIVLVVVVAVAWVGFGMMTDDQETAETTTLTLPTSPSTGEQFGVRPLAPVTVPDRTVTVLLDALNDVGTGRFAAVVGDRFYVLDARSRSAHPVDMLGQFAGVEARSGTSLLVRTRSGNVLFGTERDVVTDLGAYRLALPATEGDRWWLVDHDGMLRDSAFGRVRPIPEGVRLIGELGDGFLVLTEDGYASWDGRTAATRPLSIDGSVLSVTDTVVVTRSSCSTTSCVVGLYDAERGSNRQFPVPSISQAAEFSASRSLLALRSTRSEIAVVDMQGTTLWFNPGRGVGAPASSFSWTTNSDELVVVEEDALVIWRGLGSAQRTVVGVPGLTQIVALP